MTTRTKKIEWQRSGSCMVVTSHKPDPTTGGYIRLNRGGKCVLLHRLVCERRHGPLGNLLATHSCDTPACINPDHLTPGTQKKNMSEASDRNRIRSGPNEKIKGIRHGGAKLTDEQVIEIRGSKELPRVICERFGVSEQAIRNIRWRKNWPHLEGAKP